MPLLFSPLPGNISPHHDEMSSETPPSYSQLNYNDNLTRFFNSQPKTLTEKEANAGGGGGGGNGGGGGSNIDNSTGGSGEDSAHFGESWWVALQFHSIIS